MDARRVRTYRSLTPASFASVSSETWMCPFPKSYECKIDHSAASCSVSRSFLSRCAQPQQVMIFGGCENWPRSGCLPFQTMKSEGSPTTCRRFLLFRVESSSGLPFPPFLVSLPIKLPVNNFSFTRPARAHPSSGLCLYRPPSGCGALRLCSRSAHLMPSRHSAIMAADTVMSLCRAYRRIVSYRSRDVRKNTDFDRSHSIFGISSLPGFFYWLTCHL
jgi:hypothetical protein